MSQLSEGLAHSWLGSLEIFHQEPSQAEGRLSSFPKGSSSLGSLGSLPIMFVVNSCNRNLLYYLYWRLSPVTLPNSGFIGRSGAMTDIRPDPFWSEFRTGPT